MQNTWSIGANIKDPGKRARRFNITSEFGRRFYFIDDEMVDLKELSDRDRSAFEFLTDWAESRNDG